jgi:hypothetical protein
MIPFTQYLRPDGRQIDTEIERPEEIEIQAHALISFGCHFDAEVLRTGEVSLTCERNGDVLAIRVCENGPPVLTAVDEVVAEATRLLAEFLIHGES